MKRRVFLKKGAVAAALVSFVKSFPLFATAEGSPQKPSGISGRVSGRKGSVQEEIRSSGYLRRVKADKFLPGPPVFAESYLSPDVKVSPMALAERIRRKIVPRHGFCSIAPGKTVSEGLTSGNGAMNIEMTCDPYSEQILFHHESLLMPWKRPLEAPKVADIFPQVRQMVMDGKYQRSH